MVHFADLHLGVESGGRINPSSGLNQRVHDACDRLDELCALAETERVHAVVFAGDAFKNQHPSPTLQSLFAGRIRRLARAGIGVFLLIGNHDLPKMAGLAHPFSIYDALEVDGVVVGDRAKVYRVPLRPDAPAPELQIAALPHFSRHEVLARIGDETDEPEKLIDKLVAQTVARLQGEVSGELPAIFCGHCHVSQADLGGSQPMFGVSDIEVSLSTLASGGAFPYYALGHIHRQQVLREDPFVAYPGSLERIDFGEGDKVEASGREVTWKQARPKGFFRLDLERTGDGWGLAAEPVFHDVAARRFITVRLGELADEDALADIRGGLERVREHGVDLADAFVKLAGRTSDRGMVTRRAVRELVPEAYDVQLVLEMSEPGADVRDPRFGQRMAETEALERFLENQDDPPQEGAELLRLGRELIAEVLG